MKTLILSAFLLATCTLTGNGGYAQNEWLRNTHVCKYNTMEGYAATVIRRGAVEHALSEDDATAMLGLYRGFRNFTQVRLFTTQFSRTGSPSRYGTLILGDSHGCAIWPMHRRLDWISEILGRDIVHPARD